MNPPFRPRPRLVKQSEQQFTHYQAKLPEGLSNEDYFLIRMEVGEIVWTTPDALFHDDERWLWLYGKKPFEDERSETYSMKVYRDAEGFHVDASRCGDQLWPMCDELVISRVPVVTFTIGDEE